MAWTLCKKIQTIAQHVFLFPDVWFHQVQLYVWYLLSEGKGLLHWLLAILQAGHFAILCGQTAHGCHHRHPAGLRQIQGWRL